VSGAVLVEVAGKDRHDPAVETVTDVLIKRPDLPAELRPWLDQALAAGA
jgi:hypothetical protein